MAWPSQRYDQAMRELFRRAPVDLVRTVVGVELGPDAVVRDDTVLFTRRLEVDGLVVDDHTGRLVHLEFQTRRDPMLGWRMARYWLALTDQAIGQSRSPGPAVGVESHVVLLHGDADAPGLGRFEAGGLTFRYGVHRLWQLDPDALLAVPALAALAPLARAADLAEREELLGAAIARVAAMAPDEAARAVTWAGLLGSLYLDWESVGRVLRRSVVAISLEDFPLYQELRARGRAEGRAEGHAEGRAEGRAEGHAEGRAEGHAEGRAEGRAEGQLAVLRRLVDSNYHDPALTGRLSQLPAEVMDEAVETFFDADRDAFTAWVTAHTDH